MTSQIEVRQWETDLDGIDNLKLQQTEKRQPASDEILVKITAVSLNYKDAEIINGLFKHHKAMVAPPHLVPCSDSCGHVIKIGEGVTKWKRGDRILSVSYPSYLTGPQHPKYLKESIGSANHGMDSVLQETKIVG
jgi:NADPH:quinone reductase-like Zn-dependent oxidoreductase